MSCKAIIIKTIVQAYRYTQIYVHGTENLEVNLDCIWSKYLQQKSQDHTAEKEYLSINSDSLIPTNSETVP